MHEHAKPFSREDKKKKKKKKKKKLMCGNAQAKNLHMR
jgi:hypothetical protein